MVRASGRRTTLRSGVSEASIGAAGASALRVSGVVLSQITHPSSALDADIDELVAGRMMQAKQNTVLGARRSLPEAHEAVARLVADSIASTRRPLILMSESQEIAVAILERAFASLEPSTAPSSPCFFSTLQTRFDPTLHVAVGIKGLIDLGTFPRNAVIIDVEHPPDYPPSAQSAPRAHHPASAVRAPGVRWRQRPHKPSGHAIATGQHTLVDAVAPQQDHPWLPAAFICMSSVRP